MLVFLVFFFALLLSPLDCFALFFFAVDFLFFDVFPEDLFAGSFADTVFFVADDRFFTFGEEASDVLLESLDDDAYFFFVLPLEELFATFARQ